jgi:transglutaminase-like putative cysteine protease
VQPGGGGFLPGSTTHPAVSWQAPTVQRTVSASLDLTLDAPATLVLAVAVSRLGRGGFDEQLVIEHDGQALEPQELLDATGTRLHRVHADAGAVTVRYDAEVPGQAAPAPFEPLDLITYLRPSRYCESDSLLPTATAEFAGLTGKDLLDGVSSWVGSRLSYVLGSSGPTDGALVTLESRQGVCRDYAHLVVGLLRALDVPARLAAVYAPGLAPMDFHAVAEAWVGDGWQVVDATTLAPRQSLLRIATGRDAADTAFLTSHGGLVTLDAMEVTATADALPEDDLRELVQLR